MYKTVLFDLDGTLLNTIGDLAAAGNYVCRLRGWQEHSVEEFQSMVGHGLTNLARKFSPEDARDPDSIARTLADFSAYYGAHSRDRTVPYPGIPDLLERLRAAGLRLAVCSNKDDVFSRDLMEHYFPGVFHAVRGKREGVPVKPNPTIVRGLLEELGRSRLCGGQRHGHPHRPQHGTPRLRRHLGLPAPGLPGGSGRRLPGGHRGGAGADHPAALRETARPLC